MKFTEFEDEVREAIGRALLERGYSERRLELLVPGDASFGDLSCAVALKLARESRRPPGEIAREIVDAMQGSGHLVGSASSHPSGYLNFTINWDSFSRELIGEVIGKGVPDLSTGGGKKVIIEHTNVNPNKALHIGHARNLVLGDSLARIMRKLGYAVEVLNYIDDSGAQVADVIVGLRFLGYPDEPPHGGKFDAYCGDTVYINVNKRYDEDPSLRERQRYVLQEIERGNGELSEYARRIVSRILADQLKTCWRLGARYDLLNWESHILGTGMWSRLFEELKREGIAVLESEGANAGCWVLKEDEQQQEEEKVLVRSDGTAVYVAKDIPYAAWKIGLVDDPFRYSIYAEQPGGTVLWTTAVEGGEREHPSFGAAETAISVIDVRQSRLQKIVGRVLQRMEGGGGRRYLHRGYEVVALSKRSAESLGLETGRDFVHMSGRKGLYINVDTVLEALKRKAEEETQRRNPSEAGGWVSEVAERIAVAALRFELVKQDPDKLIVFDVESSLRLEGETGPYLLYSYARAGRIGEKAGVATPLDGGSAETLTHPKERELMKAISTMDKSVVEAGEYLSPKEVARYSFRLCSLFNEFYESVPVNREVDERVRGARLALVEAFRVALREALSLIGIEVVERI